MGDYDSLSKIFVGTFAVIFCSGVCIPLTVQLSIHIPAIVIGKVYENECPVQPKISEFLFIFGLISLFAAFFSTCCYILISIPVFLCNVYTIGKHSYDISIRLIIFTLITIGQIVYLIFGSIWTFGVYKSVQFTDGQVKTSYCHKTLFRMTVTVIIISYIQLLTYAILLLIIWCRYIIWVYLREHSENSIETAAEQEIIETNTRN